MGSCGGEEKSKKLGIDILKKVISALIGIIKFLCRGVCFQSQNQRIIDTAKKAAKQTCQANAVAWAAFAEALTTASERVDTMDVAAEAAKAAANEAGAWDAVEVETEAWAEAIKEKAAAARVGADAIRKWAAMENEQAATIRAAAEATEAIAADAADTKAGNALAEAMAAWAALIEKQAASAAAWAVLTEKKAEETAAEIAWAAAWSDATTTLKAEANEAMAALAVATEKWLLAPDGMKAEAWAQAEAAAKVGEALKKTETERLAALAAARAAMLKKAAATQEAWATAMKKREAAMEGMEAPKEDTDAGWMEMGEKAVAPLVARVAMAAKAAAKADIRCSTK